MAASPAVGRPADPITLDARARNTGSARAWHCMGCGCGNGIDLAVLGPDGTEVALIDPNAPRPLCADGPFPLEPGGVRRAGLEFNGTLYVRGHSTFPSPTYAAPPGTYTLIGSFTYSTSELGDRVRLERRTTFVWRP